MPKRRRVPLLCWCGFHKWGLFRPNRWYCQRCPATKGYDPVTETTVVDTNRSQGKW